MEPIIELKNLTKTFGAGGGQVSALRDVSLAVYPGEIFGIIGLSLGDERFPLCAARFGFGFLGFGLGFFPFGDFGFIVDLVEVVISESS